ncbi:MAG: hypothetical protein HYS17_10875 [Micavibrio aeruginosavorus]|uniref:Uncharacterized protein n=1 Tax=Micavibrio aeruginosavorus TaxID=349221 RepID=A0A7T5R1T9_9BACT|nr:MAG: hypothetical protein HYS17_10875 [Micavibrio aeruginosavorus]
MKKFFSRLLGGFSLGGLLSSFVPRDDNPDTFAGEEWADTKPMKPVAAHPARTPAAESPGPARQFVHYLGRFDGMNIEINGQPVKPEQITHYKGTKLTCEKFTVDLEDTTYVFWNDPSEQQKKIQTGMKVNTATDLGDMRGQTFGIHHLESIPGTFEDFDEPGANQPSQARRDWQPQTGNAGRSQNAATERNKPVRGGHGLTKPAYTL